MLFRPFRPAVLALLACLSAFAAPAQSQPPPPAVRVATGLLAGYGDGGILVYKGIPYAAPPVGLLRWRPPQPPSAWSGIRSAAAFGPACLQPTGAANVGGDPGPVSEDCLTLNVWAPKGGRRLPVMVWIHGGGHRFGSASQPYYDGTAFARDDVIFVSFNYRLAGLGFFAHPALTREAGPTRPLGDYGVMDQAAALAWVKRNIGAFGGDPGNVTVFGESSSAIDVQALLAARLAPGLFQRAIVESSCDWADPVTISERQRDGVALAAKAGLGASATAAELRALPGTAFLDPGFQFEFAPFPDGRWLKETTTQAFADGRAAAVPLILGSNSDEGAIAQDLTPLKPLAGHLSGLYPDAGQSEAALRQLDTDRYFGAPCRWVARQNAARAPTFLYRFSYLPKALRGVLPGAPHGSELAYVFDLLPPTADAEDRRTARRMHGCWISFARTGRPVCPDAPPWPAYSAQADRLLDIDRDVTLQDHVRAIQDDALDRLVLPRLLGRGG